MICKVCNRKYKSMWGYHRARMKSLKAMWERKINNEEEIIAAFVCYDCGLKAPVLIELPSRDQLIELVSHLKKGILLCPSCKKEIKRIEKYGICEECKLCILEQFL